MRFGKIGALCKHLKIDHERKDNKCKRLHCAQCGECFVQSSNRLRHVRYIHGEENHKIIQKNAKKSIKSLSAFINS